MEKVIRGLIEQVLADYSDLFLVDFLIKGNPGNQRVLVFIDSDETFSIDRCAEVSRKLGMAMETDNLIEGKYTLEVSSPGLEMPLVLPRQYQKNLGRNLKVELSDGHLLSGALSRVEEDKISLRPDSGEETVIKLDQIKKARVEVSFK